eukprot:360962-Lingulodinium_polyedra.AAC.1
MMTCRRGLHQGLERHRGHAAEPVGANDAAQRDDLLCAFGLGCTSHPHCGRALAKRARMVARALD